MENLLRTMDPLLIGSILMPLTIIVGTWALRMACAICTVPVPDFLPAAAVVVVTVVANFGVRLVLNHNDLALGLGSQLLLILLTSATVISLSVRTSIASAIAVTIAQIFFCGVVYFGVNEAAQAML